jgi:two-component system, cell cycle sensor histidine kinase and response regulator CckA
VVQQTVLVVDDEDSVRSVLTRMLKTSGYAASSAATAAAALKLHAEGHRFDLIICDQRMPGMSGDQCLECIWDMVPDQKVLRVAGAAHEVDDSGGPDARKAPVLVKPFTMDRLLASVRDALSGSM